MKHIIRGISILMPAVFILASCPSFNAFAAEAKAQDVIPADGLVIEVKTDKSSYDYFDTAAINVKVSNKYDFPVENVTVCLYSDSCKLPKGEKCISDKMNIKEGKSETLQFHAKFADRSKLNIFQKIIFFFRNLFNPSDSFKHTDEKENFETAEQFSIRFGTADCIFNVTVYYTYKMQETDEELEELLNSDRFEKAYNRDKSEAFDMVTDCLDNMKNEGLVGSYSSDEENKEVWFEYLLDNNKTAVGGVDLLPPEDGKNSSASAVQAAADGEDDTAGSMMFFDALSGGDFNSNNTVYNKICASLRMYNNSYGHLKFRYEDCKNLDCSKPSFICLSSHGGETTKLNIFGKKQKPYIMMSDYPSGNPSFEKDKIEKKVGTLFIKNIKYSVIFPGFFKKQDFRNAVVFFESCCAFGGENNNTEFADALIDSGCLAVIGFQYDVDDTYSADVLKSFIEHFRKGESLNKSLSEANEYAKSKMDKEPDLTTGILRYRFNNSGDETILDCGPDAGKRVGLRVHYEDTTRDGNAEDDLFIIILSKDVLEGKSTEEIAATAVEEIEKLGIRGSAKVVSVNESGSFYDIDVLIAN